MYGPAGDTARGARARARAAVVACLVALVTVAACDGPAAVQPPRPPRPTTSATYTDSSAVRTVAAAKPFLLVGTDAGLLRWDLRGGPPVAILDDEEIPAGGLRAIAILADGRHAIVPTANGVGWVDLGRGTLVREARVRGDEADTAALDQIAAIAPDDQGNVWLGGPLGLMRVRADQVLERLTQDPVDCLWTGPRGELLVGGPGGLWRRDADGALDHLDASRGSDLARVRLILTGPDGGPVVVGEGEDGSARLVVRMGGVFVTYRLSPATRVIAGTRAGDALVLASATRFYTLRPRDSARVPLRRDGARLVPLGAAPRAPYLVTAIDSGVTPNLTALAAAGDELFVGTDSVGTAGLRPGTTRPRWFRLSDLAGGQLSIACAPGACLVTTGGGQVFRWDEHRFARVELPEGTTGVIAVARDDDGTVLLATSEAGLALARLTADGTFGALAPLAELPASALERVRLGQRHAWLITTADGAHGELLRVALGDGATTRVPVPAALGEVIDVVDAGDATWVLGARGVVTPGGELVVTAELLGEPARAVAIEDDGTAWIAGPRGVARVPAGETAALVPGLPSDVRALLVDDDGRLWLGTDRGVAMHDGQRLRRVEARAGVLAEPIFALAQDASGRIWSASAQGLGIVQP